jgi:uncharacterized protein (DUF433 family)
MIEARECFPAPAAAQGKIWKRETIMLGFDRITFDTNIMGGRACIRGKRVTVSLIINLVANGMAVEEIVDAYPYLESEDVRQALQYAAWLAEDSFQSLTPATV